MPQNKNSQRKLKFFQWGPPEEAPEPVRQAKKPGGGFYKGALAAKLKRLGKKPKPTPEEGASE
jgi:hypothetical protein